MDTFVGSLPCVYPSVSCKTRRLKVVSAKESGKNSTVEAITHIREALPTSFLLAVVRFLASVRTNMHRQCTPLNEALATSLGHA